MGNPRRRRRTTGPGFTLVELVLTVALLLLLAGAVGYSFNSARRGAQLEEGAGQLESLFRFARAQAAGTGRRVQVSFGETATVGTTNAAPVPPGVKVQWEPDPLAQPGRFVALTDAVPFTDQINDLVQFRPVQESAGGMEVANQTPFAESPAGALGSAASATAETGSSTAPLPIGFYPDGSSDSAEFIVLSLEAEDRRRLHLSLSGLTGTVRRKWLAPEGEPELPEDEPLETSLPGDAPASRESRAP